MSDCVPQEPTSPLPTATNLVVIGMAGSGKSTFVAVIS